MESINMGELFLFKDGKQCHRTLYTNEEERANVHPMENTDIDMVMQDIYTKIKNNYFMNDLHIFQQVIDFGYSVIMLEKKERLGDMGHKLYAYLSEYVKKEDMQPILQTYKKLQEGLPYREFIYNFRTDVFGKEYDYVDRCQNQRAVFNGVRYYHDNNDVIYFYLKEKLGELSSEEEKMFAAYRNFDLELILTQKISSKYPVNNGDAGVIIITPGEFFQRTCHKMQHGAEIDLILSTVYSDLYKTPEELGSMNIVDRVQQTQSVIIQVSYGSLLFWIPEKANDFQKENINEILAFAKGISQKQENVTGEPLEIFASIEDKEIELEDLETFCTSTSKKF